MADSAQSSAQDPYRQAEIRAIKRVMAKNNVTYKSRAVIYRDQAERWYGAVAEEILDAIAESRRREAL